MGINESGVRLYPELEYAPNTNEMLNVIINKGGTGDME